MADGRAEGSSEIGDEGQVAVSCELTYVIGHVNARLHL